MDTRDFVAVRLLVTRSMCPLPWVTEHGVRVMLLAFLSVDRSYRIPNTIFSSDRERVQIDALEKCLLPLEAVQC